MRITISKEIAGIILTLLFFIFQIAISTKFKIIKPAIYQYMFFNLLTLIFALFLAKKYGYLSKIGLNIKGFFPGILYSLFFVFATIFLYFLNGRYSFSFSFIRNISLVFFLSDILIVVLEELVFRSIIISNLIKVRGALFALIASSLIFSFFHLVRLFSGESPGQDLLANATVFGLTWGVIFIRSKSIFPSIISHLVYNILVIYLPLDGEEVLKSVVVLFTIIVIFYPLAVDFIEAKRTKTKPSFAYNNYLSICFILLLLALLANETVG